MGEALSANLHKHSDRSKKSFQKRSV